MKKLRLFCLPYAGGSSVLYHIWKPHLREFIDLVPIELKGRGTRRAEPLYTSFEEAVADVFEVVRPQLNEMPYAFFGHSMGSWLVYELNDTISQSDCQPPLHLFLSGRRAPHIPSGGKLFHTLPDDEFESELLKLGGTTKELLENKGLRELFMHVIKADFRITETYRFVDRGRKVNCPVTVMNGKEDQTITIRELFEWRKLVSGVCSICNLDGGHFFVSQNVQGTTRVINQTLEGYLA